MDSAQRTTRTTYFWAALILLLGFALRVVCVSDPYFVDAPAHVHAIESGTLLIQPPGYYLFNLFGRTMGWVGSINAAHALRVENLFLGEAGLFFFALLALRRLPRREALLLTLCFAVSPLVWFAADIHSSYAAMSCFGPLLFLCFEEWGLFSLGMLLWAMMLGFRQSDGAFVLPWVLWQSLRYPWSVRLRGAVVAVAVILAWWVPTARGYGSLLSPLGSSKSQVGPLAHGLLTGHISSHTALEVLRVLAGMALGWGVLLPVACVAIFGCWRGSRALLSVLIWTVPGLAFFLLYYVADPVYVVYFVAPGLLAAGMWMAARKVRWRTAIYVANVVVCLGFMLLARPVVPVGGTGTAVLDAYVLKFTRWSLEHRYAPTLSGLVCGGRDIRSGCVGER